MAQHAAGKILQSMPVELLPKLLNPVDQVTVVRAPVEALAQDVEAIVSRSLPTVPILVQRYRELGNPFGEVKALLLQGRILEGEGRLDDALEVLRSAFDLAEAHDPVRLGLLARIRQGWLLVKRGDRTAGFRVLEEALGKSVLAQDRQVMAVPVRVRPRIAQLSARVVRDSRAW